MLNQPVPAAPEVADRDAPAAALPIRPLRLPTLVRVETRKALDTRGGRGVLIAVFALAVIVSVWQLSTASASELSVAMFIQGPVQMVCMIIPLIGLLAMTSEFTQRTALTTFTLAPWRLTVLWAKVIAATVISIVATVVSIAIALVGAIASSAILDSPAVYDGLSDAIRGLVLTSILNSILAIAIGALIAQTAVAASTYFVAPVAFSLLAATVLKDLAPWFDIFTTFDRLASDAPFTDLAQTGTAVLVWVVIPAVLGALRAVRREVK